MNIRKLKKLLAFYYCFQQDLKQLNLNMHKEFLLCQIQRDYYVVESHECTKYITNSIKISFLKSLSNDGL